MFRTSKVKEKAYYRIYFHDAVIMTAGGPWAKLNIEEALEELDTRFVKVEKVTTKRGAEFFEDVTDEFIN